MVIMKESGETMDLQEKVNNIEKEVVKLNGEVNNVKDKIGNAEDDIKSINRLCNQLEKFFVEMKISNQNQDKSIENQSKIIEEMRNDKKKKDWFYYTTIVGLLVTYIWQLIIN